MSRDTVVVQGAVKEATKVVVVVEVPSDFSSRQECTRKLTCRRNRRCSARPVCRWKGVQPRQ